jgi:Ni/Fe-hydrogenase subunit HybB-like protein
LVKGAFIIAGYSLVLALHFLSSLTGNTSAQLWLILPGLPLGVLTAVYTAYLFAQAKARDLWQSPLLPPHLLVQSLLLGAAALMPFAVWLEPSMVAPLAWTLGASSLIHLLMVWGEVTLAHPTAHATLAVWEMRKGRYAAYFWTGILLTAASVFAPWLGVAAAPLALVGMALHEHAYVQAGQAVPLA